MTTILGIDPGHSGALAFIDTTAARLWVYPMPVIIQQRSAKTKTFVDEDKLTDLVERHAPSVGWIEDVFAIGGGAGSEERRDGVVGAFSFGEGKGVLKGVLGALRVPRCYVSPNKWKADLRVPSVKQLAKKRAWVLFPHCASILTSEGKAEAAMIALYGCLLDGVQLPPLQPR